MIGPFEEKPDKILSWLNKKGFGGGVYDALYSYFQSLISVPRGKLNDLINAQLTSLGYGGTLRDKLNAFLTESTGLGHPSDAERLFFSNSNFSFSSTVKQVATGCRVCQGGSSTNKQSMTKTRHIARDNITFLRIAYPNWFLQYPGNTEAGPGGTATISASIEYPDGVTVTQVKWNGASTHSIPTGQNGPLSDYIPISIPSGTAFFIRTYVNSTSSTCFEIVNSGTGDLIDTANGEVFRSAISGLSDQTMTTAAISGGSAATRRFGPTLIVTATSKKAALLFGDSKVYGINDVFTGQTSGDKGELERSVGPQVGYLNCSQPGQSLQKLVASHTKQVELYKFFTHIVMNLGINDVASGRSPAQMTTDYATIVTYFPGKIKVLCTLTPYTTSTDSWATTVNQTVTANEANRLTVNTANLVPRSGFTTCFDFNAVANTGEKWIVDGNPNTYTADGLHETQAANLLYLSSNVIPVGYFN